MDQNCFKKFELCAPLNKKKKKKNVNLFLKRKKKMFT